MNLFKYSTGASLALLIALATVLFSMSPEPAGSGSLASAQEEKHGGDIIFEEEEQAEARTLGLQPQAPSRFRLDLQKLSQ